MPSRRPTRPSPSGLFALTLTRSTWIPSTSARRLAISGRWGASRGAWASTVASTLIRTPPRPRAPQVFRRRDLDVAGEAGDDPHRMAEALDQHRVVGADHAVAPRLLVRLAQERGAEGLRRLHRPQPGTLDRRLHHAVAHT